MGRNRIKGLEFFPFDVDYFSDIKVRKLIKYQGGKAVTVYLCLLCMIYKEGYYMKWDKELPFIISENTGFDEAYIQEVIECCMRLGLVSERLFKSSQVVTSRGIQQRYQRICARERRLSTITDYSLIDAAEDGTQDTQTLTGNATHEYFADMKRARAWLTDMSLRHHLTLEDIMARIDTFMLDCRCRAKQHTSLQDAQQHFNDWLVIQLKQQSNATNNESTKQKTERPRRTGTDPRRRAVDQATAEPDAYKGKF